MKPARTCVLWGVEVLTFLTIVRVESYHKLLLTIVRVESNSKVLLTIVRVENLQWD